MKAKPKFDFDDVLEYEINGIKQKFTVVGIRQLSPGLFYYTSHDQTNYPENGLKLAEKEVILTRDELIKAWNFSNGSLWSSKKEHETLNSLLYYFEFERI